MKRFIIWWARGGDLLIASCRDCDFRMEFELPLEGAVILDATNTHDCLRDGD